MDLDTRYEMHVKGRVRQGKEPDSKEEWLARQPPQPAPTDVENDPLDLSDAAVIAAVQPEPEPEDEPDSMTFYHPGRFHVEIMQAGEKQVVNGQVVVLKHKTIEFNENHWTADMNEPEDREKVEWLLQSKEYRKGNIVRVDQIVHQARVQVRTGPRTTTSGVERIQQRPAGELSAPLN